MSAYSDATEGVVISGKVCLLLNTLDREQRMKVLCRAYELAQLEEGEPIESTQLNPSQEKCAQIIYSHSKEIKSSFMKRQKQSRMARAVGATRISRPSHDNREIAKETKEESTPPTPPTKEERKEININKRTRNEVNNHNFTPPTSEEVKAYCELRGNSIDPQKFIDFYEAKGWMIGKNKMKDWKAAIRTWEGNRNENKFGTRRFDARTSNYPRQGTTPTNYREATNDQRNDIASVL